MDYKTLATDASIQKVIDATKKRNIEAFVVVNKEEALTKIKELIPAGASVMNGSSVTLEEIGYIDHLKSGKHNWINPKDAILAEKDPVKQSRLRKEAVLSDYYLGSVHGIAETGELVFGSNTGSQMPHIVYTSPNIIFVAGTHKIVPTLADALERLEKYVVPLEDEHMKKLFNTGTNHSKTLIFRYEPPFIKRKVRLMLVKEVLGF